VDQGAVSSAACTAELPSLVAAIDAGEIGVKPSPAPLEDVERVWLRSEVPGARTVLVPADRRPCGRVGFLRDTRRLSRVRRLIEIGYVR
jgi:hypothetical protein